MAYNTEGRKLFRHQVQEPGVLDEATLAGNRQLTASSGRIQRLLAGGAHRDVVLPGPDEGVEDPDGLIFEVVNVSAGAHNLVVKTPAGATVATVAQNRRCTIVGKPGGWASLGIVTIA